MPESDGPDRYAPEQADGGDNFGKGNGVVDGELVREFPVRRNFANRKAGWTCAGQAGRLVLQSIGQRHLRRANEH